MVPLSLFPNVSWDRGMRLAYCIAQGCLKSYMPLFTVPHRTRMSTFCVLFHAAPTGERPLPPPSSLRLCELTDLFTVKTEAITSIAILSNVPSSHTRSWFICSGRMHLRLLPRHFPRQSWAPREASALTPAFFISVWFDSITRVGMLLPGQELNLSLWFCLSRDLV